MISDNRTPIAERSRVSILERLIPSLSFGLAALSGVMGAFMILRLFLRFGNDETVDLETVLLATGKIDLAVGSVLWVAAILGLAGISVCIIRMFTATQKASSPGFLYLIAAAPSLAPPLLVAYVLTSMVSAVKAPAGQDLYQVGATAADLSTVAIIAGGVAILVLLAFSFVPFSSSAGKKYSPLIFIVLIEIAIACLAYLFFSMTDVTGPGIRIGF